MPVLAAIAAVLLGWSGIAAAVPASAAPPKCSDLNGTVDASQMCRSRKVTPAYSMHIAYPVNYPDVQPVFDCIKQTRDGFVNVAKMPDSRTMPYQLEVTRDRVQLGGSAQGHAVGGVQDIPGCRRGASADLLQVVQLGSGLALAHRARPHGSGEDPAAVQPGTNPWPMIFPMVQAELEKQLGHQAGDRARGGPESGDVRELRDHQ